MKQLNRLIKYDIVKELKDVKVEKDRYTSCQARKQDANTPPNKSIISTSMTLELLHMDLFVPTIYTSIGSNKYGLKLWMGFLYQRRVKPSIFSSYLSRDVKMSLKSKNKK